MSVKLALFLPIVPKNPKTGGEIYNRHLLDALEKADISVKIFTLDDIDSQDKKERTRQFYEQALKWNGEIDVLLFDTWLYRFLWPFMYKIRRKCSYKIISFSQLCYWDTYRSFPHRFFHRLLTWATLLPAHTRVGVSQTLLKNDLGVLFSFCQVKVIYPGCPWAEKEISLAQHKGLPAKIVSIGNYAPRKGFHVLVEALGIVAQRNPELVPQLSLTLVGNLDFDPKYVEKIRKRVEELKLSNSIILNNWKTSQEVSEILSESQLFAFASQSEGFGMVVLEAMLHGLPVMLNHLQVAPELIGQKNCGFIIDKNSPDKFAEKIIEFFHKRDQVAMSQSARERALEMVNSWEKVGEQFVDLIKKRDRRDAL